MEKTPSIEADDRLVKELAGASAGLLYPSESDFPFNAFCWKETDADAARQIAARRKDVGPIQETSVDAFFAELLTSEEGEKFKELKRLLLSRLVGPRVLRAGQIQVDVYLVGRTPSGNWAGLHTVSIET